MAGRWTSRPTFLFLPFLFLLCHAATAARQRRESIIGVGGLCLRNVRQLPCDHVVTTFQVESRSPDRNESSKEEATSNKCTNNGDSTTMYLDNEVSVTTPLTGDEGQRSVNNVDNEGDLSEVDITSQHNSVISQTPDSTISGPVPVVICETPGERLCDENND